METQEGLDTPDEMAGEMSDTEMSNISWDSYLDISEGEGIAADITNGIRVEDIVEPPSQYRYAAFGKADPFIPPMLTGYKESSLEIPIVSVLQRYRVGNLRIVGLWEITTGERKALIMTPKEEGIIATVGDSIGKRGGKILSIEEDSVNVREFTLAPDGTRQFEDTMMYLGNEQPDEEEAILLQAIGTGEGVPESALDDPGGGFLDSESNVRQRRFDRFVAPKAEEKVEELPAYDPTKGGEPNTPAGVLTPPTEPAKEAEKTPDAAATDPAEPVDPAAAATP